MAHLVDEATTDQMLAVVKAHLSEAARSGESVSVLILRNARIVGSASTVAIDPNKGVKVLLDVISHPLRFEVD